MSGLEISGLSFAFGGVRVVDDFSLDLRAREMTALIGPNGAGKTTLLNLVGGFLRPARGSVALEGHDVTGWRPDRIARAGLARSFQDLRLIGELTARENALLAVPEQLGETLSGAVFRPRRWRAHQAELCARTDALLGRLGLGDKAESAAKELSYGQQKALVLVCCLASGAEVLLLDEPFAGLDPVLSGRMLELLRELATEGKAVLFVEHNLDIVAELADRVCVMDMGAKIADGPPTVVLDLPETLEAYLR